MATPETRIKQKLNRRDDKIAKMARLMYRRLTFGPYSASGLPDRLVSWGTATVAVEAKANDKRITPLQQKKLNECNDHGVPAMPVLGDQGVDNYYKDLREFFTAEAVEERMVQYETDCYTLRKALEELIDD